MQKQRDSNIELLRIIATLFILIVHCNGWFLIEWGNIGWLDKGLRIGVIRSIVQCVSSIGVVLFVLISGFYGIHPKLKSIVNLFTILLFFYVGCYLLDCYYGNAPFTWKRLLKNMLVFSRTNWFINCYLFLMLLSPVLNAFMEKVDARHGCIYIVVFLLCSFYWGCLRPSEYFYFNNGYSVTTMVLIYLIGRYMNMHLKEMVKDVKYIYIILAYFASLILMIIAFWVGQKVNRSFTSYCSPFNIFSAVCFFWLFYRMPSFSSDIVNWLGKSCLAVFIFHTCSPIIGWFANNDVFVFLNNTFLLYCGRMMLIIMGVFSVAILLDKVRLFVFKPIIRYAGSIKKLN